MLICKCLYKGRDRGESKVVGSESALNEKR